MGKRAAQSDPHVDALQKELLTLKEQCAEARMFKAKEGAPAYPFPIVVHLTVPRPPSAAAFDVDAIPLKLTFDAGAELVEHNVALAVEPRDDMPPEAAAAIGSSLEATWRQQLAKRREAAAAAGGGSTEPAGWLLKGLISLVVAKYAVLLQLLPSCVEEYMGCDDLGATLRRFMLVPPRAEREARGGSSGGGSDSESGSGSGEEGEMDEEARAYWEEQERRKAEAARQQAIKDANEAEARRQEVERLRAAGVAVDGPRQLSKKELEEQRNRKRGQGNRLAKTGSRANKFSGEGSALAREDEKKKGKGGK